ncbi:hypothetical protein K1T71_015255 [Dendrolimus kikuchii]|nr:hypothetical protein K1T71_015255 [Dendrolimus kikuchii]
MLSMGWKPGQCLGVRSNETIHSIEHNGRQDRVGLGLGAQIIDEEYLEGPKGRFVDTPADLLDETAGVQAAADVPMSEVTPPLEQKETMQVGSSRAVEASSDDELLDLSRLGLEEEGDPNGSPFLQ